jgi:predicted nucleotidyltransferase component of viral defense system
MLYKNAVSKEMLDLIIKIQSDPLFDDYYLIGGTALSLQLGHRTSTDIDLFTPKTPNIKELENYFHKNYKENLEVAISNDNFLRLFVNEVKVELGKLNENDRVLEKPQNEEGIKILSINEIASMKLSSIKDRTKARDFIDIAYLLQKMPLSKIFDLYSERHDSISPLYMKRTLLVKSKSIKEDEWLKGEYRDIKMLKEDIKPKDVPIIIEKAIEEYNKSIHIAEFYNLMDSPKEKDQTKI